MIRVMIAQRDFTERATLCNAVSSSPGFIVVGQAENGKRILELLERGIGADVLVTELDMPLIGSIELAKILHSDFPSVKMVLFTSQKGSDVMAIARIAGICGYLTKDVELDEVLEMIAIINSGEYWYPYWDGQT